MMSTMWFEKKPGDVAVSSMPHEVPAVLVGDTTPDWVRLPPELGGARVQVLERFTGGCPCRCGRTVEHFSLPDNLAVAECLTSGFLWYRRAS